MTESLLTERPDLDAVYYSNDDVAIGGLFHCLSEGVSVPERLRLAGFNGLEMVDSLPAPLATTVTDRRGIGREAAKILLKGGQHALVELVPKLRF